MQRKIIERKDFYQRKCEDVSKIYMIYLVMIFLIEIKSVDHKYDLFCTYHCGSHSTIYLLKVFHSITVCVYVKRQISRFRVKQSSDDFHD